MANRAAIKNLNKEREALSKEQSSFETTKAELEAQYQANLEEKNQEIASLQKAMADLKAQVEADFQSQAQDSLWPLYPSADPACRATALRADLSHFVSGWSDLPSSMRTALPCRTSESLAPCFDLHHPLYLGSVWFRVDSPHLGATSP